MNIELKKLIDEHMEENISYELNWKRYGIYCFAN